MNLDFQKFQLRAHIYQCRNLPAADANGLSDPYLKVKIAGNMVKTEVIQETLNPTWYTTLTTECTLPTPLEFAPDIWVQVYGTPLTRYQLVLLAFVVVSALLLFFSSRWSPSSHPHILSLCSVLQTRLGSHFW